MPAVRRRLEELHEENADLNAQLDALDAQAAKVSDADLIQMLPHAPGLLLQAPDDVREALFAAFGIHCTYRADQNQVTIRATITIAEHAIAGHHFLRKGGKLRLRVAGGEAAAPRLAEILDTLTSAGAITGWTPGIYEPEVAAFGGPAAMTDAHRLFCADSRAALALAGQPRPPGAGPRERAVLLVSTMIRSAGLDWFEMGDVCQGLGPAPRDRPAGRGPSRPARRLDGLAHAGRGHGDPAARTVLGRAHRGVRGGRAGAAGPGPPRDLRLQPGRDDRRAAGRTGPPGHHRGVLAPRRVMDGPGRRSPLASGT